MNWGLRDLTDRALNQLAHAAGGINTSFIPHIIRDYQAEGFVVANLEAVLKLLLNKSGPNLKVFDINGVIIPSPVRNKNLLRLLLSDKNIWASILPRITPRLASSLIDPGIIDILHLPDTNNIVASASKSWLPWAGPVVEILRNADRNIQIFHSVHRGPIIPPSLRETLEGHVLRYKQEGVKQVNVMSLFDVAPTIDALGTDMLNGLVHWGDGRCINTIAQMFRQAGIEPSLSLFMVNSSIERLCGAPAMRVDMNQGKLVDI